MSSPQPDGQIRVLLVDDQTLVRHGIRSLLELSDEVEVVGEAEDGHRALEILRDTSVDVMLLDLRMPGLDGVATLEAMARLDIGCPVLVLTTFDDEVQVVAALRAGARGYMLKDVTLDELLRGVRAVADGGSWLQAGLTQRLLQAIAGRIETPRAKRLDPLTGRELDVLRLAAAGWSNREIAAGLHLAEGTVKNHMSAVLLKMGVRDRTRAVLRALEEGLLSMPATPD